MSPGVGSPLDVAVCGGGSGRSARSVDERGLPFFINAHSVPHDILDSAHGYREAFHPGPSNRRPFIGISVYAVVADTHDEAARLEASYVVALCGLVKRGIYNPVVAPDDAAQRDHEVAPGVQDVFARTRTLRIAGTPDDVASSLRSLARRPRRS